MLFKAALINIFILTMDEITMSKVKGDVCCDELTENHHLTLLFPSSQQSLLASFSK